MREIDVFFQLLSTKSVRELARRSGESPSQISKSIKSLENKLAMRLIERHGYGVEASAQALEILPLLERIRDSSELLSGRVSREPAHPLLTVATTSFLSTHLLPSLIARASTDRPQTNWRVLEMPPHQFIAAALRGGFQMCISLSEVDWPKSWTSTSVGQLEWALVCRKKHPLPREAPPPQILKYPFVYPVYWNQEGFQYGDDSCPVPIAKRLRGHETATAVSALEIVLRTDQLAFLPEILVREQVEAGNLRVLKVPGWKRVVKPLFLAVKNDGITQPTFSWLKKILAAELS